MDIVLLKTLIEVARYRHFGRAAAALCVTQSAVSARIKLLESTLDVVVFERRRGDIRLTVAGQRLLVHAEHIVRAWARAREDLALNALPLVLGCQPELWDVGMRALVLAQRRREPACTLDVRLLGAEQLAEQLLSERLDLAVVREPLCAPGLDAYPLGQLRLCLVSSHPDLNRAAVLSEDYVLVDWGTAFMQAHTEHFPGLLLPAMRLDAAALTPSLLTALSGTAYLPERQIRAELRAGHLFAVAEAPVIEIALHAVIRQGASPARLDDALSFLREEFACD